MLLAVWCVRLLVAFAPEHLGGARPRLSRAGIASFAEPGVDWRVIAFGAGLALAAGLLAGLVPALRATRGELARPLKAGGRGGSVAVGSLRRPTVLSAATTLQVACALVLLLGAGMLLQGFTGGARAAAAPSSRPISRCAPCASIPQAGSARRAR